MRFGLWNVRSLYRVVSNVRQIEVHTAEPLGPCPSLLRVEIAIAKLKKYKSSSSDSGRTDSSRRQNVTVCDPQTH
jgi:hypothetical protein